MSFILDALRKSDAERQRTATPGLADVRYAVRRTRRNVWLPLLVVVLAANVVFMGVWWFGSGSKGPAVAPAMPAPAPAAAGQPTAVPAPAQGSAPAADIRPLARETEYGEPLLEPEVDQDLGPPAASRPATAASRPDVEPAPAPAPEPSPVTPAKPSRILTNNELPTATDLIGSGALSIPILNLDLHVYSDKPTARFVVINSRKYKEGGQLTEGPTVEAITKDGVILVYQGRRFTLGSR